MAPARTEEDADPITASYSIYLTPPDPSQIYLLQYPNRSRNKPYNARLGVRPQELRIKPKSGHLELDIDLNTGHNFNKYRALKWSDAMTTAKDVQNDSATFGLASGFSSLRVANARRAVLKDPVDRELELQNSLTDFSSAEAEGKVMHTQTLGGQITKHDSLEETGKPHYFVGAFRGDELHLTKVAGTVQMRPQFHHLDAEDQREHVANSRAAALDNPVPNPHAGADVARVVHQSYKSTTANPKGELEQREQEMKTALQSAYDESWVKLEYVDEDDEEAYKVWNERMFVGDTREEAGCARLKSAMPDEEFLDAISAPAKDGGTRKRRKVGKRKEAVGVSVEDGDEEDG